VWNIIERAKKGRVVILTTHSMEEADTLADTVGKDRLAHNSEFLRAHVIWSVQRSWPRVGCSASEVPYTSRRSLALYRLSRPVQYDCLVRHLDRLRVITGLPGHRRS
jgi:hypothetical protein